MLDKIEQDILPNALMIGVDYDLFWELNPKSLQPFIKAFELKQRYDDSMAWQLGGYIRLAIGSCFNKGTKYPSKPTLANGGSKQMSAEEIKSRVMQHATLINSKFRKEG